MNIIFDLDGTFKYGNAILDKYVRKYIPVQRKYIEEWKPRENVDILICNEDYRRPVIAGRMKISGQIGSQSGHNQVVYLDAIDPIDVRPFSKT